MASKKMEKNNIKKINFVQTIKYESKSNKKNGNINTLN